MFGLQIRGSVSRSNSVIRTASGCSSTINSNHLFRIKNYPNEHRISRFSSGIRSISHPTDLSNFVALKKATATTDHTRLTSRTASNREEDDYEENEEVEEERKYEMEEAPREKKEEEGLEETRPKYAVSFLPYFQKEIPDQFRENEDFDMEDLNQEAHNKYSRAVEERDATETIRYRVEVAKTAEEDDKFVDPACMVRDLYQEEQLKSEEKVFSHIQPCNMRPFGANDSLFFPQRNSKARYPVYRKFGENDPSSGSSQQRDYSTTSRRTRCEEVKTQKSDANRSKRSKEQRPCSRKSSGLRKERKETCGLEASKPTLQTRLQSQWQNVEAKKSAVKPPEEEKRVLNKALKFAKKYHDIYLGSSPEKLKPAKVQCSVNILAPKKSKGLIRQTTKINLLQSSLSPEEAALADVKPSKNKRMTPPWPSYSETLHRTVPPISTITFPNPVYLKKTPSKTESLQAREFSTGHQKRRLGNKKNLQWTFRLPRRGFSSLFDRPDCPKPRKARMKDCRPIKRPKKKRIKQERKCIVEKVAEICPERADRGLKVKRKKLPEIVPGECKRETSKLKDCAPIKRLKKVRIPEPLKCQIKKSKICIDRADDDLKVKKKKLPVLEPEECPKPKSKPMKDVKLARLKKVKVQPPPRVCVKKKKFCPPRADASLKSKRKKLPVLEPEECPKPPSPPRKDAPCLERLKKIDIKEPPKICEKPKKFCPKRADEGLKVSAKCLPDLEPFECPKPGPKPLKDCRSLQRLPKMEFDEPAKCKIVRKKVCSEIVRADANLKVKSKRLPELVVHEGCQPKSAKMKDCKPIKRLKKVAIPEPKVCSLPKVAVCDVKRADGNLATKRKRLPKLEASDCPKVPSKPMKDVKLARLAKVKMQEPPKICLKPKRQCFERADDSWKLKKKRLPELEIPDCPKVSAKPMKNVKLLRLKKVIMEEPKKICPKQQEKCPERADVTAGYRIKKKPLRTVILSKKYNDVSFRHFKRGKKKTKAPYFNTKRDYCLITRSYSNSVYYHPKLKRAVYRAKSISSKDCTPKKPLCPPPTPPCPPPPKKSLWQRICDYFRARPGCPPPDEWKKKRLREKAEKAARAAGMYLCECPRVERKRVCFKKKPSRREKEPCPKFKMPYCKESVQRSCEEKVTAIECDPPRETPYPSFSEWKREMMARKISECTVADKNAQVMKGKIKALNKRNKNKKRARCFSTSSCYTRARAARIINELDRELQKTTDVDNAMVKKLFPVL